MHHHAEKWGRIRGPLFAEYERLWRTAPLSAVAKVGEALMVVDDLDLPGVRAEISSRVDPTVVARAAVEAAAVQRKARQILSIGVQFDGDEIMLVLTMRMQVQVAEGVAALFDMDLTGFACKELDEDLRALASSKGHRRAFASVLATMRRNWHIPIADRWSAGRPS